MTSVDTPAQRIDILMKEYADRSQEILRHTDRYHSQSNFLSLFLTIMLGLISGLRLVPDMVEQFKAVASRAPLPPDTTIGLILLLPPLIAFFFLASAIDALFMMYLNGARRAAIETTINTIIDPILYWDSNIVPHFFSWKAGSFKTWLAVIQSSLLLMFFVVILSAFVTTAFVIAPAVAGVYTVILIMLSILHVALWVLLHSNVLRNMREYNNSLSRVQL